MQKVGLVLTGGGARAAYQAGALKAISEICGSEWPFQIYCGISAGAINAAYLSCSPFQFETAADKLCSLWEGLVPEKIYRTDFGSLSSISMNWISDLSLGGMLRRSRSTFLLDSTPLTQLLNENITFEGLDFNIASGRVHGLALTSTHYNTGYAVTFFDGRDHIEEWDRSNRIGTRTKLNHAHLRASSAIPVFFPPVQISGAFYGDGAVRSYTPLSPAVHLGCTKAVAIGVRYTRDPRATRTLVQASTSVNLSAADIAGVLLNALFLDSLDADVERMRRINETLRLIPAETRTKSRLREIPLLVIRPSRDLGNLARNEFNRFPPMLRYLLRGLGASEDRGWDLLSYLAFHSSYTVPLLETGYNDAWAMKDEIKDFFAQDSQPPFATPRYVVPRDSSDITQLSSGH